MIKAGELKDYQIIEQYITNNEKIKILFNKDFNRSKRSFKRIIK